jgi:hypothetical protein
MAIYMNADPNHMLIALLVVGMAVPTIMETRVCLTPVVMGEMLAIYTAAQPKLIVIRTNFILAKHMVGLAVMIIVTMAKMTLLHFPMVTVGMQEACIVIFQTILERGLSLVLALEGQVAQVIAIILLVTTVMGEMLVM